MQLAHLAGTDAPLAVVADGRVAPLADRLGIATVDELIASGVDASGAAAAALDDAAPLRPGMLAAPCARRATSPASASTTRTTSARPAWTVPSGRSSSRSSPRA
jgi:hypothetical protein